jgi:hypothetical protein
MFLYFKFFLYSQRVIEPFFTSLKTFVDLSDFTGRLKATSCCMNGLLSWGKLCDGKFANHRGFWKPLHLATSGFHLISFKINFQIAQKLSALI